jgi:hypothetical protein
VAVSGDPISQLDSDFAQLTEEIERIKAQPHGWGQEQLAPLLEIKETWMKHLEKDPTQAAWRRILLTRLAESYENIIRGGHRIDMDGKMSLEPGSELLTHEMTPVIEEVIKQGKIWLKDTLKNLKPISIIPQKQPDHPSKKSPLHKEKKGRVSRTSGEPVRDKEDTTEQSPQLNSGNESPEIEFKIDLSSLLENLFKPPEK